MFLFNQYLLNRDFNKFMIGFNFFIVLAIQDKLLKIKERFFSTMPTLLVGDTKIDNYFSTMQHIVLK